MGQKILFTFTAQDVNVAKTQDDVKDRLAAINKEIKAAKAAGSPYGQLLGESVKLKREAQSLREEQAKLNKEFKATTVPKDSLTGLRLEYSKLTDQVNKLSAAERNSKFGQSIVKNAARVKGDIDGIEQSLGRFTGNVGNYKSALLGIGNALTGGLIGGGIVAGITAITNALKAGAQIAIDYEKSLSRLSAITGVTGPQLDGLVAVEKSLRTISANGVPIVSVGQDILDALTLVGSAQPELLDDAVALGEVTKQAIILSKASGDELNPSIEALTTTLGQFNLGADDAAKVINELAAGSKFGSAEIPQITAALKEFGKIAEISNVTTAESIALIETEAKGRLRGAEAGTQLRNILIKLASADVLPKKALAQFDKFGVNVNVLKDSTIPLIDRLKELGKITGDVTALAKVFGVENVQGAAILTSLIPEYEELTKKIAGTDEAYRQAAIQADNTSTGFENLGNSIKNKLQGAFESATPILKHFSDGLRDILDNGLLFRNIIEPIKAVGLSSNPFDPGDPFGPTQRLGVVRELTQKEKNAARDRAIELVKISAQAGLDAEKEQDKKNRGSGTKRVFSAGSLGALQQSFDDIQKKISNTPGNSPLLEGLIKDSIEAEQKIQSLKNVIDGIRNPATELTDEQRGLELATGIDPDLAVKQAKELRDKLGAELGGIQGDPAEDPTGATLFQLDQNEAAKTKANNDARIDEEERVQEALQDAAINSAQVIVDSVFQIKQNNLQRERDAQLTALDKQEQAAIDAANGNAAKEKLIRADFEKRRSALEKKFANDRKELARKEALINIALSITKALTGAVPPFNFILAGVAAIAGAAQLAVINSQQFAHGGTVKRLAPGIVRERQNAPRTANGDTVLAYLKPGEMVLNEGHQQAIAGIAGSDVFQKAGVPGVSRSKPVPFFASGGVVDFVPQTSFAQSSGSGVPLNAQASFTEKQVEQIGSVVGKAVADAVGPEVRRTLAEGLGDANRRLEREESLQTQRQG